MADITQKDIKKIAKLAHINIPDQDIDKNLVELGNILDWVDSLKQVDVSGVSPQAGGIDIDLRLREDQVTDGGYAEQIVKNAPLRDEHFFAVPKVVE